MLVISAEQQQLRIVLHTDLGRLTAQLAARWGNDRFAALTPYIPMLVAAQEHAASWRAWEMKPYLDLDGRPIDAVRGARYLGPHWTELCVEAVAALTQRDAYAAVMASLHWETLLERVRDVWPLGLESVLAEQHSLREHLIEAMWEEGAYRLETDAAHLVANQSALDTLDQVATWLVSHTDTAALGGVRLSRSAPGDIVVDPYPFGVEPLEVTCAVRTVPDRSYPSQNAFLEEFYRAALAYERYVLTRTRALS